MRQLQHDGLPVRTCTLLQHQLQQARMHQLQHQLQQQMQHLLQQLECSPVEGFRANLCAQRAFPSLPGRSRKEAFPGLSLENLS